MYLVNKSIVDIKNAGAVLVFTSVLIVGCGHLPTEVSDSCIKGHIRNENGLDVVNAQVTTVPNTGVHRADGSGRFDISNIVANTYILRVEANGYTVVSDTIRVSQAENINRDYWLSRSQIAICPDSARASYPYDKMQLPYEKGIVLSWVDKSTNEYKYDVRIGTDETLTSAQTILQNSNSKSCLVSKLDSNVVYYWQVLSKNRDSCVVYSDTWKFIASGTNRAIRFSSGNESVQVENEKNTCLSAADFSIEFKCRVGSMPDSTRTVLSRIDSGGNVDCIVAINYAGYVVCRVGKENNRVYSVSRLGDNAWHSVALTYEHSRNVARLYIDGVLETEKVVDLPNYTPMARIVIGSRGNYESASGTYLDPYYGDLDEVRIWQRVRSAVEIQENMMREIDPSDLDLYLYYNCNEISSDILQDKSRNRRNGAIHGELHWCIY